MTKIEVSYRPITGLPAAALIAGVVAILNLPRALGVGRVSLGALALSR